MTGVWRLQAMTLPYDAAVVPREMIVAPGDDAPVV